ncbi:MAG: hypothetical protein HY748_18185 [Elusimicrobia bacterium]|nr:hypothetical protein [Elusimicrobiota bacterium]
MTAIAILEADAPLLGLWDRSSPANKPGHYDEAWDAAWEFDRDPPYGAGWKHEDMEIACEHLDQYWNHRQARGELMVWKPGSGVYKVELRLLQPKPKTKFSKPQRQAFLVGQGVERILVCASGDLIVSSLRGLGSREAKVLLRVHPGKYRVGMDVRRDQLARVRPFKSAADYPKSQGPDFVIFLQNK